MLVRASERGDSYSLSPFRFLSEGLGALGRPCLLRASAMPFSIMDKMVLGVGWSNSILA